MRTAFLYLFVASAVAGCGLARQVERQKAVAEANRTHEAETAECRRLFPDPNQKPTMPRVKCLNEAAVKFSAVGSPNPDLVRVMTSEMLVVAEQYDAGRLSTAQYEARKATILADLNTHALQRQNSTMMATAAVDQAAATRAASAPRTCTAIGNTMTCY